MKFKELLKTTLFTFKLPIKTGLVLLGNLTVMVIVFQFSLYGLTSYYQTDNALSQQYYKVFDNFNDETVDVTSSDFLIKLKSLYSGLMGAKQFVYLDISYQPVLIDDSFAVNDYLLKDYDKGQPLTNIRAPGSETVLNGYNSVQMDERTLEQFALSQALPDDVKWQGDLSTNSVVPILLGNDFKSSSFDESATYSAKHLNIPMSFKIVGYLPKDSSFYNGETMVDLDRQIVIPAIEYSAMADTDEEWRNQKRIYIEKLSGTVLTNETRGVVQSIISGICAENLLPTLSVQGTLSGNAVFKMQAYEFAKILLIICAVLSFFAAIGLILSLTQDMMSNFDKFAVHLLCGGTVSDVYKICFIRYLATCMIAVFFSIFIANLIIPVELPVILIFSCLIIVLCLIFMLFPRRVFRKRTIGSLLRRNDE